MDLVKHFIATSNSRSQDQSVRDRTHIAQRQVRSEERR